MQITLRELRTYRSFESCTLEVFGGYFSDHAFTHKTPVPLGTCGISFSVSGKYAREAMIEALMVSNDIRNTAFDVCDDS